MTARKTVAVIALTIRFTPEDGIIFVSSKDLPGLYLAAKDVEEIVTQLDYAVKTIFREEKGLEVEIYPVGRVEQFPETDSGVVAPYWAAVPAGDCERIGS